jgi:hypothetical protein
VNETQDHELDERLRREFEGPIPDDGFATRVMRFLPPRPRKRALPLPAAATVGSLLAWLALAPSPLVELAAGEWLAADFGPGSAMLLALMSATVLLGCAWALEEGP